MIKDVRVQRQAEHESRFAQPPAVIVIVSSDEIFIQEADGINRPSLEGYTENASMPSIRIPARWK